MRRLHARFSGPEASNRSPYSADSITTMFGFGFSVHTGSSAAHPLADGGHRVEIKMSMTAPGCGMGDVLKEDACRKVQGVAGVTEVDIEIVWEPAWDQSRMSEAAQLQLGLL